MNKNIVFLLRNFHVVYDNKKDLLNNKPTKIIEPQYVQGVHGSTMQFGVLVHNWRTGWKWFSNVAFAGIVAVQTFMTHCHLN